MPPTTRPKRKLRFSQPKKTSFPVGGSWAKSKILTPQSAIITQDLQSFLVTAISGWANNYTDEERRLIIDTLPPADRIYEYDEVGTLKCPISLDFVMTDPFLKRALSKFKDDVSEGSYEEKWQRDAKKAMQERADGKFDEHLKQQVEEMFGDGGADESANDENDENHHQESDLSSDGSWSAKPKVSKSRAKVQGGSGRSRGQPRKVQAEEGEAVKGADDIQVIVDVRKG